MSKLIKVYQDFRGGWNADTVPELLADNELVQADDVDFEERGGLNQRKAWLRVDNGTSLTGIVYQMIDWPRNSGTNILLGVVGTNLVKINDDGSITTIQALSGNSIGYFVFQDRFYFVDGSEYYVFDGTTCQTVQLAAPSTAPTLTGSGSGSWTGIYKGVVVFVNSLGYESPASPEGTVTLSSNAQIDWSNIPIGPSGTVKRKLYRTAAGGNVFKYLATINDNTTTTYTDTIQDVNLGANLETDNDIVPIKRCKFMLRHPISFRIFAAGDSSDKTALYYSESNRPDYWKNTSKLYPTTGEGPIQGLALFGDAVLIFFQSSIWAWQGADPMVDATWKKLPIPDGTESPATIALTPDTLTYLGRRGLFAITLPILGYSIVVAPGDSLVRNLAENKVNSVITTIVDRNTSSGIYDPQSGCYYLAYYTGLTSHILVFDWALQSFRRYTVPNRVYSICLRQNGTLLIGMNQAIASLSDGSADYTGNIIPIIKTGRKHLDIPLIQKKLWKVFVSGDLPNTILNIATRWSNENHTLPIGSGGFIWGEPWGAPWGYVEKPWQYVHSRLKDDVFQFTLTGSGEGFKFRGIAVQFRSIRPKGVNVDG